MNTPYPGDAASHGNPPFTHEELLAHVQEHRSALRNIAVRFLLGWTEIDYDEAINETYIRALPRGESCDRRYVGLWLCRICANWCKDQLRRKNVRERHAWRRYYSSWQGTDEGDQEMETLLIDYDPLPGEELLRAEDNDLVRATLVSIVKGRNGLRPNTKSLQALLYCYALGLTTADAAKRLGIPEGTLKTRLRLGRQYFKEEWEKLLA